MPKAQIEVLNKDLSLSQIIYPPLYIEYFKIDY